MKLSFYYSLLISTLIVFQCTAYIFESDTLSAVLDYCNQPNTLVVWDIDNTLARVNGEFGSDEWFCYQVNKKMAEGYSNIDAITAVLPISYYAQFNLPLVLTERIAPAIMTYLIMHNIYSMGLTSRGPYLAERTYEQLKYIDILFFMPDINREELILHLQYPCLYKYNIIFCSNNNKGEALFAFLDFIGYKPDHIVFVDDKMYHLLAVEQWAASRSIDYVGIRYSGCDDYIARFDPAVADIQLQMLRHNNNLKQ